MSYSVKELADISGVSVRTLHHYEEKGLLHPRRSHNNYRCFDENDVARLQQILLYREAGIGLAEIKSLIDADDFDVMEALERHLDHLRAQRTRIDILAESVEKTITTMKKEGTMNDRERFEGFKRNLIDTNEKNWGAEVRASFGDEAMDTANARVEAMSETDWKDTRKLEDAIKEQLVEAIRSGGTDSHASELLFEMHARWIKTFWGEDAYSPEAHAALAEGYVADPRFAAYYDAIDPQGAHFIRDVIVSRCTR